MAVRTKEEVEEFIYDVLHPTAKDLLDGAIEDVVDLESVLSLHNAVVDEPVEALGAVVRVLAITKMCYANLKGLEEELEQEQTAIENEAIVEFTKTDSEAAAAHKTKGVTVGKSYAKSLPSYLEITRQLVDVKKQLRYIGGLINVFEIQHDSMVALVGQYSDLPASSVPMSREDIRSTVAAFQSSLVD